MYESKLWITRRDEMPEDEEDTLTEAATEGLDAIGAKCSKTYTLNAHAGGSGVGIGRAES